MRLDKLLAIALAVGLVSIFTKYSEARTVYDFRNSSIQKQNDQDQYAQKVRNKRNFRAEKRKQKRRETRSRRRTIYNFHSGPSRISRYKGMRTVPFTSKYKSGTIIVKTKERKLYYILDSKKAIQYGVGVGRDGFQWRGTHRISRKAVWPSWRPPAEMRKRQPELPKFMEGGPNNPLGARALYIGGTLYRIHGTNEAHTIGYAVSSGCIRMLNSEVIDLYNRVKIGSRVIVM